MAIQLLLLFWAAQSEQIVKVDQYPLRSGCGDNDSIVARLRAGDKVAVKFSLAGAAKPCFLVSATIEGKTVDGYVLADALGGAEEFERARREAAPVVTSAGGGPPPPPKPAPPLKVTAPALAHPDLQKAVDLLDRNQPGEALALLEKLIQRFPKQAGLLALAGTAAYRSDNLRDALYYWRESLYLKPDPVVERMYKDAQQEASADRSGEKKYGMRFLLRYDGAVADPDAASAMVAMLDEEFSRIASQLGCRTEERIVTIVQNREAYQRGTGAAEWSGALYDGKIRVPLVERRQLGPDTRQIFAHEIVHACLANIGKWPTWLHEGLAQKLSGASLPAEARQIIKDLARAGKLPRLTSLEARWSSMNALQAQLGYTVALAAIELFFEHHREFGIRNLMNNPERLKAITDDLDRRLQAKE